MIKELLDISCPICNKKDDVGWWDSWDDCVVMFCTKCDTMYQVMNDGKKHVMQQIDLNGFEVESFD